jgi:PAS domain S-box-containing protein
MNRETPLVNQKMSGAARHAAEPELDELLEALQRSEARYRTVFENTGTATFVKEADMTISMVNTGFERLTGYRKDEIEGKLTWTDLIFEADRARLAGYHADRREYKDVPREMACRIVDKAGQVKDVYLTLDLIPGTGRSIGSFLDITQLKKVREEVREGQALLKAMVECFEGQIYVATRDFELSYMNQNLIEQVGRNAVGQCCYEALHGRKSVCPFCMMDRVQGGETGRFEIRSPRDGRWYQSINSPIHHVDGTVSLMALINDINERKLAEMALRESQQHLAKENKLLRYRIARHQKFGNIVGQSRPMLKVYEQIISAAASEATVIVNGEPGTGKELVAYAVHELSDRRDSRFVPVHCGAIPENLAESEFFGYVKGAFSGADADKQGYIDFADGGTLFLDEVGEISLHLQVKLLRVIDGGGYTPVGSNRVKNANVRIIAATNRDLKKLVAQGRMREDFYYRINILPIFLPPLRQRKEDLPLLVDHFFMMFSSKKNIPPITGKMMEKLLKHDWPGNVRELQNVIIRYCSLKKLDFTPGSISQKVTSPAMPFGGDVVYADMPLRDRVGHFEKQVLLDALETHRWHRSRVAEILGIDRKTLFNKMKQYGLIKSNR